MKLKLCLQLIVASLLLIVSSCSQSDLSDVDSQKGNPISVHKQVQNLYESFASSGSKSGTLNYPEYFGGSFVNENSELVILVVGEPEDFMNEFSLRVGSNQFILEKCQNSYSALLKKIDTLDEFYFGLDNKELKDEVQLNNYYIDTKNNNIVIGLGDCSLVKIKEFNLKIAESPFFVFEEMDSGLTRATSSEVNNLLDYILTGSKYTYFRINNYMNLGVEGTSATNCNVYLGGRYYNISAFQCVNANPSGKYDMYMYTRTRLSNYYDIGGGIARQQMGTYSMSGAFQDRGILIAAPVADANALEDLFRKADS